MSKIICDVCGTSYPDTVTQCPICGCVRSAEAVMTESVEQESGYTYIKGGRFSRSNVRKRNQGIDLRAEEDAGSGVSKKSLGLIIVLVCLIAIVCAMIVYVLVGWERQQVDPSGSMSTTEQVPVACTELKLSQRSITLSSVGEVWLLEVTVSPADTTDVLTFASVDETVATVSQTGKITFVGEGETDIIVTCGTMTATCRVVCETETTTEQPTVPPEEIQLNRKSILADFEGYSWVLYSGKVPMDQIVWTSEDPSVATVEAGKVVAVAEGETTIYAEYNGVITSCTITCNFAEPTEDDSGSGETPAPSSGPFKIYCPWSVIDYNEDEECYDVTMPIGESIEFSLKTKLDAKAQENVTWTIVSGEECVTLGGSTVTVVSSVKNARIKAEYNGETYYLLIRTVN